ncbi:winged helix-turn-helix domain-containing protein [Candidatus Pelagibacter sp.]|nr:winged helix-turn-helix domain-containing protein [Candidatus Pelagibacter sp.]
MSTQNLIIYKFISLYHILEELSLDLNFKTSFVDSEKFLKDKVKNLSNHLIISNKKNLDIENQLILESVPIKIFKLVEKINIEFLRIQFNGQSQVKIKDYSIDLNSREIIINNTKLKLTEKEINTISYLSKSNKPVNIEELQEKVWSYQSDVETHTVETHIYRLRKKFLNTFNDNEFIVSKKNGYQIK